MTPTINRAVHYVMPNGQHRAAIISNVFDNSANLMVLLDGKNDGVSVATIDKPSAAGQSPWVWATSVRFDETHAPGTWHWPEREEALALSSTPLIETMTRGAPPPPPSTRYG